MKGEEYLHPVDCELFAHETISCSHLMPGAAIFQHRWEADTQSQRGAYSIHSAQINPYETVPITLGLFGPEADALSFQLKDQFGKLIEMAREAWQEAGYTIEELNDRFPVNTPYLLVNRCSGRILHVSEPALKLIGNRAQELVDQEFSAAIEGISSLISHHRLKMTRFEAGPYMFASVEWSPTEKAVPLPESSLNSQFIHKLRNKLTAILSASEYLAGATEETQASEVTEIGQMIQSETQIAEQIVARMQLLETTESAEVRIVNLSKCIEQAVDRTLGQTASHFTVRYDTTPNQTSVTGYPLAVETLIETILLSHYEMGGTHARIKTTSSAEGPVLVVTSDTRSTDSDSPSLWQSYSVRLAEIMKVRYACSAEPTTGAITTLEFTIA
jgi:hypothetical protein